MLPLIQFRFIGSYQSQDISNVLKTVMCVQIIHSCISNEMYDRVHDSCV